MLRERQQSGDSPSDGGSDQGWQADIREFLSPLQVAATEIVPQGVSIALSIRELVRQGYLYSAAILIRPLVERTGTIRYLQQHPDAVEAWRSGWPRKAQPTFDDLLELLHPNVTDSDRSILRTLLHKLVHSDPAGSVYNMPKRADGVLVFSSGKVIDHPLLCDAVCLAGRCYLQMLNRIAADIFPMRSNKDLQPAAAGVDDEPPRLKSSR